jgi:DNA-binding CsgD family transcriptional regulator
MSFVLCPSLVGRAPELRRLSAALDDAAGGRGGVIFLAGEAGVGKSRLAREVTGLAASRGFDVLTGRATESAVPCPFRPIAEALIRAARHGLSADAQQVAAYRPALGLLVPEWRPRDDSGAEISGAIVAEGLVRLLTLPDRNAALLVLEDLQWADLETLAVVEYLADHLSGSRVLCLVTVRDSEPSGGLDAVRSIARRAGETIVVPRLTDSAVREMAAACLNNPDAPDAVAGLLQECDGLPFAVEEVLAAAASGDLGSPGSSADRACENGVPASIARSVTRRLAGLGPAAADVLQSAAVLGRQFDPGLLPAATGAAEDAVRTALAQATQAMLIEPVEGGALRFRHSLTRRVIVASLLPPDRAARSARAAAAVEAAHPGLPRGWCALAAELQEAANQQGRAAALLLEAGRRALSRGALASATASLQAARDLAVRAPDINPALTSEIDDVLFRALTLTGERGPLKDTADRLVGGLGDAETDPRRAQIMITTARARHQADLAAARAQIAHGRDIAARLADPELISRADVAAARCAAEAGELDEAARLARTALAAAEAAGLSGWAGEVGIEALQVLGREERVRDLFTARAAFKRAYQIASASDSVVGRIEALLELGTIEMLEDGTEWRLKQASELAHAAGAISAATVIDLKIGILRSIGDDLEGARIAARQCEQEASRIKADSIEALAISSEALLSAVAADRQAAELGARRAEDLRPGDPEILFITWGLVRVTASLFCNDVPAALQQSMTAVSYADQVPARALRMGWAFYPLLNAISGLDGVAALKRARATSAAVKWNRGFFSYAEAVMAGRTGHPQQADVLAERGEHLLARFAPRWNHLARWLIAPSALRDGWGDPSRWLREAAAEFDAGGCGELAAACRGADPCRAPEQVRRLGITSREMDVFRLLAQGVPTAQIARRLRISTKTVDTHIASLRARTGTARRRDLVDYAARVISADDVSDERIASGSRAAGAGMKR